MIIADLHSDSLTKVTAERGLRQRYNMSREYLHFGLFAAFVPKKYGSAEYRRHRLTTLADIYVSERERLGFVGVETPRDIDFALATERNMSIFTVEGGGGLYADSEELNTLYNLGMRVLGLAWDSNELAGSSRDSDNLGLTEDGRALAIRASEMGVILDVSHLSDRATEELLDLTPYPVIATHSNFRSVTDHLRNLPDSLADKIAKRGGIIGLSLYPGHLAQDGDATLEDLRRHIDYGIEHFGEHSLAFGFDIDGTDGKYPQGIDEKESIHDRVVDYLLSYYPATTVENIAGVNAIDFFKSNL